MASRDDKIARKIREHEAANNKNSSTNYSPKDPPTENGEDGEVSTPPVAPSNEDRVRRKMAAAATTTPTTTSTVASAPSVIERTGALKSDSAVANVPSYQDRVQRKMASQQSISTPAVASTATSASSIRDRMGMAKSDAEVDVASAPATDAKPSYQDRVQRKMAAQGKSTAAPVAAASTAASVPQSDSTGAKPSYQDRVQRKMAAQGKSTAAPVAAASTAASVPHSDSTGAKPSYQDRVQRKMSTQGSSAAASTDAPAPKRDLGNEVAVASATPRVAKPSYEDRIQRKMVAGTASTAPSTEAAREAPVTTISNEDSIRRKMCVAAPSPAAQSDNTPQQPALREERGTLKIQEVNALRDDPPPGHKPGSTIAALPPRVVPEEGHGASKVQNGSVLTGTIVSADDMGKNEDPLPEQYNGPILTADFTFKDESDVFRSGNFNEDQGVYEGMAYIVPEDDPDDVLISGMVIDEDLEQQEFQINKKLAIKRVVCHSGIFFAVVLAVLIPVGVLVWGKNKGTKAPTPSPSGSPSSTPSLAPTSVRFDQLGQKLSAVSDATLFRDKTTPQFKALYWLSYEDDVDMNADNVVQRYVMALFYYALNGDSWTLCSKGSGCKCKDDSTSGVSCGTISDSKPFLSDSHECDWYRLKCNDAQEITSIVLDNTCNGLKGEIPDEMKHLTSMTKFGLGNEYLTWKRVQDNVGIDRVEKENRKAHLNEISGTIPDFLTDMPNLVHVVFAKNLFTGSIPDSLYEIKSLRSLLLNRNSLDGTISSKIEQLSELRVADFSGNVLSGNVPTELEKLTALNTLKLHDNDFNGTVPVPLCGFEKLKGKITADCNATRGVEIECSPGCCNCDPVDT